MSELGLMNSAGHRKRRRRRDRPGGRRRRRRGGGAVAVVLSLAVVVGVVIAVYLGARSLLGGLFQEAEDYTGSGSGEVVVEVQEGDSLRVIADRLVADDVVASTSAFVAAAEASPDARNIQPGSYAMRSQMSADSAVEVLTDPSQRAVVPVNVPEGLRVSRTLDELAEGAEMNPAELEAAASNAEAIGLPPYAAENPEGFLFPATYEVQPSTDAVELLSIMVDRYAEAAADVDLEARAEAMGRTPMEVLTVASIIEREVYREQDLANVADVVYNRLDGQCDDVPERRLQMDSTIHYAVDDYSTVFTTDRQRQVDSPYNTYVNSGLPPGPIASPGEAALNAAANPSGEDFCFFATVNLDTGETRFAVHESGHERNVARLQAYCEGSDRC